jgi:hypothetical protein
LILHFCNRVTVIICVIIRTNKLTC